MENILLALLLSIEVLVFGMVSYFSYSIITTLIEKTLSKK